MGGEICANCWRTGPLLHAPVKREDARRRARVNIVFTPAQKHRTAQRSATGGRDMQHWPDGCNCLKPTQLHSQGIRQSAMLHAGGAAQCEQTLNAARTELHVRYVGAKDCLHLARSCAGYQYASQQQQAAHLPEGEVSNSVRMSR